MVSGDGGKDVGAAFVLHDVTERRAIEQKLLKAERFASIGELAGMLGHDLRNPLSGIRNANFYLQRKLEGKLDSKEKEMFESIDKSIDYSNKIINDLMDYASCYSNEVKLDLSPATPKSLLKAARALTDQPQNITLLDETKDSPQFYVDEVKICRSFINFLKNAFDAMPNGGKVRVSSVVEADKVTFTFKDNGCGMTKETIDKLWTPLFTTKAKGMGFGMVICKRNITAHGGQIRLESALGQGTTITVELPLNLKP
jgi:signal transduction histidine kinase